jgi:hypothetical protein
MALTISELCQVAGIIPAPPVRWGASVTERRSGVYFIARAHDSCVLSDAISAPTTDMRCIATWLPHEPVLYIGKATSLRKRLDQFYRHKYGARSPHRGGQRLKLLTILDDLWVHWAVCESPRDVEARLLRHFKAKVGRLPFANIQS